MAGKILFGYEWMKYPHGRLLLLTKAPDPGRVKTRLIPLLGENAAAELYTQLLHDCLTMCSTAALCPIDIWCSPSTEHPFFQQCSKRYQTTLHTQSAGDLGQRMSQAIQATLVHADYVVLIGADCPTLTAEDIATAFDALEAGTDVVIGPAEDGGYYLIGMREYHASIFVDIPWSTSDVLSLTENRLQRHNLSLLALSLRKDLDTPEDYAVYREGN
ncbi:MAG: TIGR04282 family arsenosugar biosynthesis glycosyltransferase [Pseudomonadota bacterium]